MTDGPWTPLAAEEWDAAVLAEEGHFLQSWRWGEFKARFGWSVERVSVAGRSGTALAQVLFQSRLTRIALNEIMFSVPFSALFAGAIAVIVYGAVAPADRSADAVRARWSVLLSMATGLWLVSMGCISILHSVYHPHGQSI